MKKLIQFFYKFFIFFWQKTKNKGIMTIFSPMSLENGKRFFPRKWDELFLLLKILLQYLRKRWDRQHYQMPSQDPTQPRKQRPIQGANSSDGQMNLTQSA